MKRFRTLVLQDLPHILPSKSFQSPLVSNYQSSTSQLHTTPSSRRFWSFFEFSTKEEPCHDVKKCPTSKDIVSSTLLSSNELDSVSNSLPPDATITSTIALQPKACGYQFDLKSTPTNCLKIHKPLKQDNLMSLLDGNPVPKTLKWKLKGYKTLRNEQAGDFAFVPGGKSYDFDILSRTDYNEFTKSSNRMAEVIPKGKNVSAKSQNNVGVGEKNTLCLTAKAIENKEEIRCAKKIDAEGNVVKHENTGKGTAASNSTNKDTLDADKAIVSRQKFPAAPKLLTSSVPKKEDIKYLPVSKSEYSTCQVKYQTQPAAQYSSRPPKRIPKPSAPILKQHADVATVNRSTAGSKEEIQSYKEKVSKPQGKQTSTAVAKPSSPTHTEIAGNTTSEWSSMEKPRSTNLQPISSNQIGENTLSTSELPPRVPQTKRVERKYPKRDLNMESSEPSKFKTTDRTDEVQPPMYFAPRSFKRSKSNEKTSKLDNKLTYESIIGIPAKPNPGLKILSPDKAQQDKMSPCAATQARLQQGTGSKSQNRQARSFEANGSSMAGNSNGGGPRKPPIPYPPFATRRSSSNSSRLVQKLPISKDASSGPRKVINSKNSTSNISTSSINPARKCGECDDTKCSRGRSSRKCERERPKCKKKTKKTCKRYCCPALQTPVQCDYRKFQCKKGRGNGAAYDSHQPEIPEIKSDPTCLPNDHGQEQGREFCTTSRRRKDSDRCCKRGRERRARSCDREEQTCQRRRSCQREERRDCSQQRDQGREICTKPRQRETCKRQRKSDDRDCGRRSAKCTGRRNYTQSAFVDRTSSIKNLKRYSSLPAFAVPLIGIGSSGETKQSLFSSPSTGRFYGKESKSSSCKRPSSKCETKKTENKCKSSCGSRKEDSCKKVQGSCETKKEDFCKKAKPSCDTKKKEDRCKKVRSSCDTKKKEDPCKTSSKSSCGSGESMIDPCKLAREYTKKSERQSKNSSCGKSKSTCSTTKTKKEDLCGKSKSQDPCSKKREQVCKDRKKVTSCQASQGESEKDRAERERKEMEECKKSIKDKKKKNNEKKAMSGLERVVSPCKQKQAKDKDPKSSCSKFSIVDVPLNSFKSIASNTSIRQDNNKLLNVPSNRSYSIVKNSNFGEVNVKMPPSGSGRNFLNYNDNDNFGFEELPVPVVIEKEDEVPEDRTSSRSSWFLSWFNGNQY